MRKRPLLLTRVSIPNGMEFYSLRGVRTARPIKVSIPNRMEFYPITEREKWQAFKEFQFPTGWNSTLLKMASIITHSSFNSQRDGILLLASSLCENLPVFQFPTGWNSTQTRRGYEPHRKYVSIPNGMEFYQYAYFSI